MSDDQINLRESIRLSGGPFDGVTGEVYSTQDRVLLTSESRSSVFGVTINEYQRSTNSEFVLVSREDAFITGSAWDAYYAENTLLRDDS